MPLFLQALPLSFQTFWRYLILLPFLAVGAFVISFAGFIPILGMLVPGVVSAGLVIIGIRCALKARGHGNQLDFGRLLRISLIFCAINIVVNLVLPTVHWVMARGLELVGIELDPIGLLVGLLGLSYYWAAVLLAMLSPSALITAALAVPMTAAAVSATPRARHTDVFFGFGTGILGLMVVMLVWLFAGRFFSIFGEVWATFGLLATALFAWLQGEGLPWELSLDPWTALVSTLFMTWASSWFFATAVLTWECKVEQISADRAARIDANHVSSDDLRTLRAKRMQSDHGPHHD